MTFVGYIYFYDMKLNALRFSIKSQNFRKNASNQTFESVKRNFGSVIFTEKWNMTLEVFSL